MLYYPRRLRASYTLNYRVLLRLSAAISAGDERRRLSNSDANYSFVHVVSLTLASVCIDFAFCRRIHSCSEKQKHRYTGQK